MIQSLTTILATLGTNYETLIMIILLLGTLVFFATGFQKGLIILLLICSGTFIWFYEYGLNYAIPFLILMIDLILLSLSIYITKESKVIA